MARKLILGTVFLLGSGTTAMAGTMYVNAANSGTQDGSAANPYKTISAAVTAAVNGDTILVAAGTYNESVAIDGKALSLLGEDPARTTIRGAGNVISASGTFTAGNVLVEIAGFTITGGNTAGILFNSTNGMGLVHNCILVSNNIGVGARCGASVNVYNNVVVGSSVAGAHIIPSCIGFVPQISVINNIFKSCNRALISTYAQLGNAYVGTHASSSYNSYFQNTTVFESGSFSSISSQDDTTDIDPLFVDANIGDYHLQPSSPSVNAGSPVAVDNDPDGTRNDQGVYGGPGAAGFWPVPVGAPVVTELSVTPHDVPLGSTITINAKGRVR